MEAKGASNRPVVQETAPTRKNSVPNVTSASAEVEKSWY